MTRSARVVVIGGGIMGTSFLYHDFCVATGLRMDIEGECL